MYRYLDRSVCDLPEPQAFLLAAMRSWVGAVRTGRCPCAAIAAGFATVGHAAAVRDFGIAMATLDQDGLGRLAFRPLTCAHVGEDEARLLALFDAGFARPLRHRLAAGLVAEEAVDRLSAAVAWVALALVDGRAAERAR